MRKLFALLIVCFAVLNQVNAQQEASHWYSHGYSLDFNSEPPALSGPHQEPRYSLASTISNSDGDLLFYSSGNRVWDRHGEILQNGSYLINPADTVFTIQSVITKVPGSNRFFIFSNKLPHWQSSHSGLYYSVVDLDANNGKGEVVSKGNKIAASQTQLLAAYHDEIQDRLWLVSKPSLHEISVFEAKGEEMVLRFQLPVNRYDYQDPGQIKFSPDGSKLAAAMEARARDGGSLDLYDFDLNSGEISNARRFTLPVVYRGGDGLEFSQDSKEIFVIQAGSSNENAIYRYSLIRTDWQSINESRVLISVPDFSSVREMQLASNGLIYITKGGGQNTTVLGTLKSSNKLGDLPEFVELALATNSDYIIGTAPLFPANYFHNTRMVFDNACAKTAIPFEVSNQTMLDSAHWIIGESDFISAFDTSFVFEEPGVYNVKLIAFNFGGRVDTMTNKIEIYPITPTDLIDTVSLCYGDSFTFRQKFTIYQWQNGDTTNTIYPESTGQINLTVTNDFGCYYNDSLFVEVRDLPNVDMPEWVPYDDKPVLLKADGEFESWEWNNGKTSQRISVEKEGWYSVLVTGSNGCKKAESVFVGEEKFDLAPELWQVLNPLPTLSWIEDIEFVDARLGYLLTRENIWITEDAGESWQLHDRFSGGKRMVFKDRIGYIVGDRGMIYRSTHDGRGWNEIDVPGNSNLNSITLISKDTIAVASGRIVYFSDDAGETWSESEVDRSFDLIMDSQFTSLDTGHLVGRNGVILKTVDRGESWYQTASSRTVPSTYERVHFVNSNVGYASREHRGIMKTTDGGESWFEVTGTSDLVRDWHFFDKDKGYSVGRHGTIALTSDGAKSWEKRRYANSLNSYDILDAVHFVNENIGIVAGGWGQIKRTLDGGLNWTDDLELPYRDIRYLQFPSFNDGYLMCIGELFKTEDGGLTWTSLGVPVENAYSTSQLQFLNDTLGFILINQEILYKTTDGGKTWVDTENYNDMSYQNILSYQFYDQDIGVASTGNLRTKQTWKTRDGGKSWESHFPEQYNSYQFLKADSIIGMKTGNGLYRLKDNPAGWDRIFSDDGTRDFQFINDSIGFVVGGNGMAKKTVNGGETWTDMSLFTYDDLVDILFVDLGRGFIMDEDGGVHITSDQGRTWTEEASYYRVTNVTANSNSPYIFGDFGRILRRDPSKSTFYQFDDFRALNISDSSARVRLDITTYLDSANLFVGITEDSGDYGDLTQVKSFSGYQRRLQFQPFSDLKPSTKYYSQALLTNGIDSVFSEEIEFVTLPKVTAIIAQKLSDHIQIVPNPTNGTFRIQTDLNINQGLLEVFALNGKKFISRKYKSDMQIETPLNYQGVLIVVLSFDDQVMVRKVIKL